MRSTPAVQGFCGCTHSLAAHYMTRNGVCGFCFCQAQVTEARQRQGFEAARRERQKPGGSSIRIVTRVLIARVLWQNSQQLIQRGANHNSD
jgi:hypothetical protein